MTAPVIVISPHLDDAALSCGGGIARLVRSGTPVTVVTVFTADLAPGEPLSPLARRSHASWGVGDRPFAVRRAEDTEALRHLGAAHAHLGLLDAIYRRSPQGAPLYTDPLAPIDPHDTELFLPRLVSVLEEHLAIAPEGLRVFCPSGTCGHVDHVLVRQAVARLVDPESTVTYDEYPYNARPGASPIEADDAWTNGTIALSAEELDARITAIGCYVSQLRGLFPSGYERVREIASARLPIVGSLLLRPPDAEGSRRRMAQRVRHDTSAHGGERYRWSPRRGSPFPPLDDRGRQPAPSEVADGS